MKTFFIAAQVTPFTDNPLVTKIESAYVYFWIVDSVPANALKRAVDHLLKYRWKLESVDVEPKETSADDFAGHEEALKGFEKAEETGFAAQFVGKPRKDEEISDLI